MNKSYKIKLDAMLNRHEINQEILISCIAKISNNINRYYAKKQKLLSYQRQNETSQNYYFCVSESDITEVQSTIDKWINYRKPFLNLIMKAYCLSLEKIKELVKDTDSSKLPNYETIDLIREMITGFDFVWV